MSIHNKVKKGLLNNYHRVDDLIKLTNITFTHEDKINVDMLYKIEMLYLNTLASMYLDLYHQEYNALEIKQKLLMSVANKKIEIYNNKTREGDCKEDDYVKICDMTKHQVDCVKSYIKAIAV